MRRPLLALAVVFVVLGTAFTLAPEFLEHSPVGFEARGVVHHAWHYLVLMGGLSLLIGVLMRDRVFEAMGLVGCGATIVLNLAALLTTVSTADVSGMDIASRVVVLSVIMARLSDMREDR